jgi:hypothetical protein
MFPEDFFVIGKWQEAEELMKKATEIYLSMKGGHNGTDGDDKDISI